MKNQFLGEASTILFKIITRMKVISSNYLGDYSHSFQNNYHYSYTFLVFLAEWSDRK